MSLSNRYTLPRVFVAAAPDGPIRIDYSEVEGNFPALFCGSNTGTSGEPLVSVLEPLMIRRSVPDFNRLLIMNKHLLH